MLDIRESKTAIWIDDSEPYNFVQANEWWNGEGLDIQLGRKNEADKFLSLHIEELNQLALIAAKLGYIDLKELKNDLRQSKGSKRIS